MSSSSPRAMYSIVIITRESRPSWIFACVTASPDQTPIWGVVARFTATPRDASCAAVRRLMTFTVET